MRRSEREEAEFDALDLAAIWPCCAPIAGVSLPPVKRVEASELASPDEEDSHGIW